MKYELIRPVNPNYSAIEQILTNRGIRHEDIGHYLNTTDEDINDPEAFGEDLLRQGVSALIQTIKNEGNLAVIVDSDCDGFTSSAVLINYLYDLFPSWVEEHLRWYLHSGKQHGLNDCYNWILSKDFNMVITPDGGTSDIEEHRILREAGISVLVLDHHEADCRSKDAIVINNQTTDYPNKHLSGVGVVWQFCRYMDKLLKQDKANNYLDLVALGLNYLG